MTLLLKALQNIDKTEKMVPICAAVAATSLAAYCTREIVHNSAPKDHQQYEKIPVPEGDIYYFGHLLCFAESTAPVITKWHEQYGPLIHVKLGVQNWVFIGDPHWAQDIFATNGVSTSGRPHFTFSSKFMSKSGRGYIFNDHQNNWKNARKVSLNMFSPKNVHRFDHILLRETKKSVIDLINKTVAQGYVEPFTHAKLHAVNVSLSTIYGATPLESIEDPFFKKIYAIVEKTLQLLNPSEDLGAYLPVLSFIEVFLKKERSMKDFWENESLPVTNQLLEEARRSDRDSFAKNIDSMKDDLEIDEENIKAILTEVFNAGLDSVSTAIIWMYIILCNHPDVQKKLTEEIDVFVKNHGYLPTFEHRLELPYYNSFQKECLRYRPINYFGIPHKATKDVTYRNYVIPKGTVLVCNTHTLHFNKNFYDEPEKFKPERFLNDTRSLYATSNGNVSNRDQFVFGWGRRLCPGISITERQLFTHITQLLSHCTIEPMISPSGEKIYPDMYSVINKGTSNHPADVKMRFIERNRN